MDAIDILAYTLIAIGLVGSVLPLLPGPLVIWLGALLWAWNDGFQAIGWPTLLVLGILTVIAWGSDLALTTIFARKAGAGWKAVGGAIAGGIAGSLLLGGIFPVCGTLLAAVAGGLAGIVAVEYLDKRDWNQAIQASKGYIGGFLASVLAEALLAGLMVGIFALQVVTA